MHCKCSCACCLHSPHHHLSLTSYSAAVRTYTNKATSQSQHHRQGNLLTCLQPGCENKHRQGNLFTCLQPSCENKHGLGNLSHAITPALPTDNGTQNDSSLNIIAACSISSLRNTQTHVIVMLFFFLLCYNTHISLSQI